jgi:triacylglycerol lipase
MTRLFTALLAMGCASPELSRDRDPQAASCPEAAEHASECLGVAVAYDTDCDAASAQQVLDLGCDDLIDGKADGFISASLCSLGFADYCAYPPLLEPSGVPTRYPIVLLHGFAASSSFNGFHASTIEALVDDGHEVFVTETAPFEPVDARTDRLAVQLRDILEQTGAEKVHLIGHSMGGLDARQLVCRDGGFDFGEVVSTITTISTPHRGSAMADVVLDKSADPDLLEALVTVFGDMFSANNQTPDVVGALESLSEAGAPAFNEACQDDPRVDYFSYAGVSSIDGINLQEDYERAVCGSSIRHEGTAAETHPLLALSAAVVAHGLELRPNDGAVTVESAQWGEFLGCVPADHGAEIGALGQSGFLGRSGFESRALLRHHAFFLADHESLD